MTKAQKRQVEKKSAKHPDPHQKDHDGMVRDVDESLRQDQLQKIWDTYGSALITFIIGIILVTAMMSGWTSWNNAQNKKNTSALIEAKENGDSIQSLTEYIETHAGTHKMIARLQLAGEYREQNKIEPARALYKQMSDDQKIEPLYRDLATLLYASITQEPDSKAPLEAILSDENSPWRAHAGLEWALFLGAQKKYDEALEALRIISALENTPTGIARKAEALTLIYTVEKEKS